MIVRIVRIDCKDCKDRGETIYLLCGDGDVIVIAHLLYLGAGNGCEKVDALVWFGLWMHLVLVQKEMWDKTRNR